MEPVVEVRQLRYFVAVAEELHFGRAAERLHMSQSPLSRAIRDLERELGATLFVRTTRRVELTEAGAALLKRARRALAEIDGAVAEARNSSRDSDGPVGFGFNPVGRAVAERISSEAKSSDLGFEVLLDEDTTPELLRRLAADDLAIAVVLQTPSAAVRNGIRVEALRDEPLLAALSRSHAYAGADAIPIAAFVEECVLLPREPAGGAYIAWLRSVFRAVGYELERTMHAANAQWDRRLVPVAEGEAVGVVSTDWANGSSDFVAVPFDPPLTMPLDIALCWPASGRAQALLELACRLRDHEVWLTSRSVRIDVPRL